MVFVDEPSIRAVALKTSCVGIPSPSERTRMVKQLVVVLGPLLIAACDTPVVPTPLPSPSGNPSPPGNHVRVTGKVTDERGMPIAGVSISSFDGVSALTHADGSYELSGAFGSCPCGFALRATRDRYESNYQWVPSSEEAVRNFRLRSVARIAAGQGLTVTVDSDDTLYGAAEQYRARRVRIVAEETGNLVVEGSSPSLRHPVLLSDSDLERTPCCPMRLNRAVSAGEEVTVHVLTFFLDVPAEFRVATRLDP